MGRTGRWFGHQWYEGVTPDVMTLAKGLGGGIPVGAVVASERAARGLSFTEGGAVPHASTFGGNAFACAAINAVIEVIENDGLLENTVQAGEYLERGLKRLVADHPERCVETRGRGLLRGLVLRDSAPPVIEVCRQRGLLVSAAGWNVIRFAPALIVRRNHIDEALGILAAALGEKNA
jgi:acetylornithine/succinyldiaminopimelate/putrescine aminotransferase